MKRLVCGFIVSLTLASTAFAEQPTQQQQTAALLRQLGACQVTAGNLMQTEADKTEGTLVNWKQVKALIEKTNPSMTFDLQTGKISIKSEEAK